MKHVSRLLNVALIVGLLSLIFVNVAYAQGNTTDTISTLFAPILAAATAIERLLQLIRNLVSPDPEKGPLARGTQALRYFTTIGGVLLGLLFAFIGNYHMLAIAGFNVQPTLDAVLTGITMGMGTEFVHQVITGIGEAKSALRKSAQGNA